MYDLELRTKEVIISSNKEEAKKEIRKVLYKLTDTDCSAHSKSGRFLFYSHSTRV